VSADERVRAHASLIAALCLVVTVAYGALYYGFSVLITERAAGAEFSRGLLSLAYGGAVVTAGLAAVPVGRFADRAGVRGVMAAGSAIGAAGLVAFAAASRGWHVVAVWWLILGPAIAMTFYEPAYVAIQQAFAPDARPRAIAALTLAAGFSGPLFTPGVAALVDALGWRDATRVLAALLVACAPVAALALGGRRRELRRGAPAAASRAGASARSGVTARLRERRVAVFTAGAIAAYGALEAVVVHRIARFEELGFALSAVTVWAGVAGLVTLPGRFLLPILAQRLRGTDVFALVLLVLAASTALMVSGRAYWQMALSFVLFGLVFGAALPLRAIVMGEWTATAVFGAVMGVQAALIAGGRAGVTALAGGMHDWLGGYGPAMALITALLGAGAVLVCASGRRGMHDRAGPLPGPGPEARGAPRD
jgi:MFS family permease